MKDEGMRESPAGRSQLSLYSSCNRKWAIKYVKGFKVPTDLHGPLHFGSVIHEVQAVLYGTRSLEASKDKLIEMCPVPASDALAYEDRMEFRKKVEMAFDKWYKVLGENDLKNMSILFVEKEIPLTLPNGFKMTVRVDRILRDPETGETFINDTKTTGWSLEGTLEKYLRHDQPRLYIAAVRENYPELVDSLSGWRTDVLYCKKAPRSPGGYNTRAVRSSIVSFTDEEIQDTLMSYAGIVDDIAGKLKYVNEEPFSSLFPANYGHCDAFNRRCEYSDICIQAGHIEEPPANLEIDPWLAEGTVLDLFKEV